MAQSPRKALFVERLPIGFVDGKPVTPSREFLLGLQKITDLIGGAQGFLPETIAGGSVYGIVYIGPSGGLVSTAAPTDGQVLIGDTGDAPVLSTLTGTTNQVTVTNGAGTITLSLPQDIHTGASPTFVAETLSGGTASKIVWLDANKKTTTTGANQTANTIYAGPSSGAAAEPAFRALVSADMPLAVGCGTETVTTAQFDKTDTTLANVTGLSVNVSAAGIYQFRAILHVTADAVGGHKYAIGGTATATSIIYQINALNNATNAFVINSRQTALAGSAGQAGAATVYTEIVGTITVNAAGTLTAQFAQNAAGGTSSVLVGSGFNVTRIS